MRKRSDNQGFDSGPAGSGFAIVTNDSTDLTRPARGIYVGVSGDVKINDLLGNALTFKAAVAGLVLPVCAARVFATGTTATNLIGLD